VCNSNAININWKNLPLCTLTVDADNKVSDAACGINEQYGDRFIKPFFANRLPSEFAGSFQDYSDAAARADRYPFIVCERSIANSLLLVG
jgi:predicted Ser/Thr protein kinase